MQSRIEKIFHRPGADTPHHSLEMLARYGIRNPADMAMYLHSPGGKADEADVQRMIELREGLNEAQRFEQQEAERMRHRITAYLLLKKLKRETRHHRLMDDETLLQMQKLLKKQAEIIAKQSSYGTSHQGYDTRDKELMDALDTSHRAVRVMIDHKQLEIAATRAGMAQLVAERRMTDVFYRHGIERLLHLHTSHSAALSGLPTPEGRVEYLANLHETFAEHLDTRIAEYESARDAATGIAPPEHTEALLNHFIEHQQIRDWHEVEAGHKLPFDENWQPTDIANAAYYLRPDLQVVRENNTCFLVPRGVPLESLSQEDRFEAHEHFRRLEPDARSVRKSMADFIHEYVQESQKHEQALKRALGKQQEELGQLQQQAQKIQEVRSEIQKQMGTQPTPKPVPGQSAAQNADRPPRAARQPEPDTSARPAPRAVVENTPQAQAWAMVANTQSYRSMMAQMPRAGMPLPEDTQPLGSLMEMLAQRHRSLRGPTPNPIAGADPWMQRMMGAAKLNQPGVVRPPVAEVTAPRPTAPTPFSMRPDPFKQ